MTNEELKPGWQVEKQNYCTSKLHALIGVNNTLKEFSVQNIGNNGSDLTIAVLSMNRSNLTIRLMESIKEHIPDFAGVFFIGDNGSASEEIAALKEAMKNMPFQCTLVEFGQNYGVSGGRNRLFSTVRTNWILSLDNDLYFDGNPLAQAQKDIAQLGCHFLVMPLLNADDMNQGIYGGHLYVDSSKGNVSIGLGSAYFCTNAVINQEERGFLCSGMPGGAAILNKHTFLALGGFDENMFVGFEDTDFSIRLFHAGYKIGSCGMISLIHDHVKPEKTLDKNYEKKRFSTEALLKSAKYLEDKYSIKVWNDGVVNWVKQRCESMGVEPETQPGYKPVAAEVHVALVIDAYDWAFDHIADQLMRHLSSKYIFKKINTSLVKNFADVLLLAEDCQIIHVFWRASLALYWDEWVQNRIKDLGIIEAEFHKRYIDGKIFITEIYDHLLLDGAEAWFTDALFKNENSLVTHYAVSSMKLKKIYDELPDLRLRPEAVLADGVDLELFKPASLERFQQLVNRPVPSRPVPSRPVPSRPVPSRPVRFGWVGNSKSWSVEDLKGLHSIIFPAIEMLKNEGFNIDFVSSDRNKNFTPFHEMPSFYENIDCYLCASLYEGTPNPVLEAMACGVPIITTDVGLVPEVFGPLQMKYVLEERTPESLAHKMRYLLEHQDQFQLLSRENLTQIQNWSWEKQAAKFTTFWDKALCK